MVNDYLPFYARITFGLSLSFPLSQRGLPTSGRQEGISEIVSKKVYPLHQQNEPGNLTEVGKGWSHKGWSLGFTFPYAGRGHHPKIYVEIKFLT